jgi:hypothetical protein
MPKTYTYIHECRPTLFISHNIIETCNRLNCRNIKNGPNEASRLLTFIHGRIALRRALKNNFVGSH